MMATTELCFLAATALASLIRKREVSPVEVVETMLTRIEELNDTLRAYLYVNAEQALAAIVVRCTVSRWPTKIFTMYRGCRPLRRQR